MLTYCLIMTDKGGTFNLLFHYLKYTLGIMNRNKVVTIFQLGVLIWMFPDLALPFDNLK